MSKVVHLSDSAHAVAKSYCKERGLRMSDWVATLIDAAISGDVVVSTKPGVSTVPKRKELKRFDEIQAAEEVEAAYSAPPFWSSRRAGGG